MSALALIKVGTDHEVIVKLGLKKLPLLPSRHTMLLMAKAAVAVYEASVENPRPEERT